MPTYIADLHLHSKYSRAVSRDMGLETMAAWAGKKGVDVLATADFTHPAWFAELRERLTLQDNGLYKMKSSASNVHFMPTTEISCIYKKGGETRRVHHVIVAPTLDAVEKIIAQLSLIGNLKADGRPILGLDSQKLLEITLGASPEAMLIPAHIWTPWFAMFGSKSGFDSVEECFGDLAGHIHAVETGLSSDPPMNWRLSQLDRMSIISSSDAHSAPNIGREATAFELEELSYANIMSAIKKQGKKNKVAFTLEFYPEEGRYHWDGHRACSVRLEPAQSRKHGGICPKCKKPLTIGVLNRVEQLADRPESYKPANRPPYRMLVPLREIIAGAFGQGTGTKKVAAEYESLILRGGSEFKVLLNLPPERLAEITLPKIAEGIRRVRDGKISVNPGYDGEYGTVSVFTEKDRPDSAYNQTQLF
ncbi:MAG: endonuclease Q family protein [Patescibacteria group bacterium]